MKALLAAAVAVAVLALAPVASATVSELGIFNDAPFQAAGCPQDCSAIGHITGFQSLIGKHANPYGGVPAGKVVAFTVALGKPNASQTQFFQQTFGGKPSVRISVLKSLSHHRGFQLVAQSATFTLDSYLGSTPSFVLATPLNVPVHSVVALTVPTWVPAFATKGLRDDEQWRSDRTQCSNNTEAATQTAIGSVRQYGCVYKGARLLYSITYVPTPVPTNKPPSKKHTAKKKKKKKSTVKKPARGR